MRRPRSPTRSPLRPALAAAALAVALLSGFLPLGRPSPVAAGTAETMEASILGWINDARAQRGAPALRADAALVGLSGDRAAALAAKDQLSHDAAGCLECQLSSRGIAWSLYGEVLASNSWPWGGESARVVFESWGGSATHWDILMNPRFDAIGVGVALSAGGTTYASAVVIDAPGGASATPRPQPARTPVPAPRTTPPPTPAPTATPAPTPEPVALVVASPCGRIRQIPL